MVNIPDGEWEVVCSREQFDEFKEQEEFQALLTLGRVANTLRFCQLAYPRSDDDDPSTRRQRINSFMFMAAALYEGLNYADTLGKYFSGHRVFKDTFGELMADDEVKGFRNGILRHLRNKVAYHFEDQVIGEAIEAVHFSELSFVTGRGRRAGETYFDMSDNVAVHSILVADGEEVLPFEELEDLMRDTADISGRFLSCADRLITAELIDMGWEAREKESGA